MRRLLAVLFWSVISAAFIGPGTVATAASAGSRYGYSLLWALLFSTIACLVLQEASGRLTVVSGRNLGQALHSLYPGKVWGALVLLLTLGAVVLGCAAYEAGNILGGVAGASLALPFSARTLTVATVVVAGLLLWSNSPRRVAIILSGLVAVMGLAFLVTAVSLAPPFRELVRGILTPSLPSGAALLTVALVGTTVVPYNLFLGSGLARGQSLGDLRFGLVVAILIGGLISMGVLVVGTAVAPPFDFSRLSAVLAERLGPWGRYLFASGLFAAGLSSAVTAPLAAAVTARSVLSVGDSAASSTWSDTSRPFRSVWVGVLGVGLIFGLSGIRPIPVIIVAQALNGVLLPVVAVFLLVAVNDKRSMGSQVNGWPSNLLMSAIVMVSLFLGITNISKAIARSLDVGAPGLVVVGWMTVLVSGAVAVPVWRTLSSDSSTQPVAGS